MVLRYCPTLVIAATLVSLAGCGGPSLIPGSGTCSDATRKVIGEFPAYGNNSLDVGDGAEGGCFASFTTPDSGADVIAYYRRQLQLHGWRTHVSAIAPTEAGSGSTVTGIGGERGGYSYEVGTEAGESPSGVSVAINVVGPND